MESTPQRPGHAFFRKPLFAYFVLSYAFFWGFLALIVALLGMLQLPSDAMPAWALSFIVVLGSWTPNLAAVTVTGVLTGREGIRQLLAKFFVYRIAVRWYVVALLPFVLAFGVAGLYRSSAESSPGNAALSLGSIAGLLILNLVQGATGEEAGWRGLALPRLQAALGPTMASLVLGLIWSFWHLPLWLLSGYSGSDLMVYVLAHGVTLVSLTFLITWISNRTPGSLVPVVLTHFAFNASLNLVDSQGLGLVPTLSLWAILAGVYLVAAILVWSASRTATMGSQTTSPVRG